MGGRGLNSPDLGQGPGAGCCVHGHETFGLHKKLGNFWVAEGLFAFE
jgi:hypothetical protein